MKANFKIYSIYYSPPLCHFVFKLEPDLKLHSQLTTTVSIVIPALNEAANLESLLPYLMNADQKQYLEEIIVVDGGSTDETIAVSRKQGARVHPLGMPSRAKQMNMGASMAKGDVLHFIHADARPPSSFLSDILKALAEGYAQGCFRLHFDRCSGLLKINAFCSRLNLTMVRGGDQTLFITRKLFNELGGYRDDYLIMEDFELIARSQKAAPFKIIPKAVIVSARKQRANGWLRTNFANFLVYSMFNLGFPQRWLLNTYKAILK